MLGFRGSVLILSLVLGFLAQCAGRDRTERPSLAPQVRCWLVDALETTAPLPCATGNARAVAPVEDASLVWAPRGSQEGCEIETLAPARAAVPGSPLVVVMRRGGCAFLTKARHAQQAGFDAVVIVNRDDRVEPPGLGPGGDDISIPVVMVPQASAAGLLAAGARASIALRGGEEESAASLARFRAAAQSSPRDAALQRRLGFVLARHRRLGEASAAYTRAVALAPADASSRLVLGNVLRDAKDFEAAADAFAAAEQLAENERQRGAARRAAQISKALDVTQLARADVSILASSIAGRSTHTREGKKEKQNEIIPRVIHLIWIGPRPLPRGLRSWTQAYVVNCPGWRTRLWRAADLDALPLVNRAAYDAAVGWSGKADIARYEILLRHGGVYIDADAVWVGTTCLDAHVARAATTGMFAAREVYVRTYEPNTAMVTNGFFGAAPGHAVLTHVVSAIPARFKQLPVLPEERHLDWIRTGPVLLGHICDLGELRDGVTLVPLRELLSNDWNSPLLPKHVVEAIKSKALAVDMGLTSNSINAAKADVAADNIDSLLPEDFFFSVPEQQVQF